MSVRVTGTIVLCCCAMVTASCERGERASDTSKPASPTSGAIAGELRPIALPDISGLAPALQKRLRSQHAMLQGAIDANAGPPQRAEAYGAMGKLLLAAELLDAAAPCFVNAQTLSPDDLRWPYYLGQVSRLTNRPADAVKHFERALVLHSDHVPSLLWLAEVQLAQGQAGAAEPLLARAVSLQPQSAVAWFRRGRAALDAGDTTRAIEYLERARALKPNTDAIGYQLGIAYRSAGDLRKAEPYLRRPGDAASIVPDDPLMDTLPELLNDSGSFYAVRGLEAMDKRQWGEAVADLTKASELSPADAGIRLNLATALYLAGDAGAARGAAEAAVRLDPRLPKAQYVLGLILQADRRDADAIQRFSTAAALDPAYVEALASLADALRRTGQVEQSLERYKQVLALNPAASQARFGYGMGLVRLGRYRDAAEWFAEASRLHRDQPGFAHALARVLAAAPDDAVRQGSRALALAESLLGPDRNPTILETIAMALAEVGRFSEAIARQREAIEAAQRTGRRSAIAWMQSNLDQYRKQRPCRQPWSPDDPIFFPGPRETATPAAATR